MNSFDPLITGIMVCHNTRKLVEDAYLSIRSFHPDMKILIIDGSDRNDLCYSYARSLQSEQTSVLSLGYNIGHGRGLDLGISRARTPFALLFDSDIIMKRSPISEMMKMADPTTYGIGHLTRVGYDGLEDRSGSKRYFIRTPILYLHPYFAILQISNYRKHPRFIHHGAPALKAMIDIHRKALAPKILKKFPDLSSFIIHRHRGTRVSVGRENGGKEIPGRWEKP